MSTTLDPHAIEKEIALIREKESNPYSAGTKTNLFTLLVFRQENAAAPASAAGAAAVGAASALGAMDPAERALAFLLGKRPARIITVTRVSSPRTEALVSGRCFPDKRNRGVCFEEVRIEAGDDGLGVDPGAWAPLLIRDLPVFAWMPDGPEIENAPWEASLRSADGLIDKLLVDTSRSEAGDAAAELRALLRLRESTASAIPLSDFSWRRGRVLREQTARAFDAPDMREQLSSLRAVRLYGGAPYEASLYFHWLQTRLARSLSVDHAAAGPLSEGFRVTFTIEGFPEVDIGCTKGGCLSRGEEKGAYRFPSDGEILLEEVDTLVRDPIFLDVLTQASRKGR
ncbi:MAG: glucose-6-phosphate dehydrogenase assembly protein OpcA [Spirochaetia bacterium]